MTLLTDPIGRRFYSSVRDRTGHSQSTALIERSEAPGVSVVAADLVEALLGEAARVAVGEVADGGFPRRPRAVDVAHVGQRESLAVVGFRHSVAVRVVADGGVARVDRLLVFLVAEIRR